MGEAAATNVSMANRGRRDVRRWFGPALALSLLAALGACSKTLLHTPVPEALAGEVSPPGYSAEVRVWGDEAPKNVRGLVEEKFRQSAARFAVVREDGTRPGVSFLALSGGADDGAYGAGLLAGWTEAGDRPEFEIVTGVSTGALIAPFAFLGSDYDATLKKLYTTLTPDQIFLVDALEVVGGVLRGAALADTTPLRERIEEHFTEEVMAAIAAGHLEGRRLFIGTTNLDAQRPVIWNIGAIAASGRPDALGLIHDIMLASASIPGVFPPVLIDVTSNGERFTEMHVDGGVSSQVFFYPAEIEMLDLARSIGEEETLLRDWRLYIIRNTKVLPEYEPVTPGFFQISGRAISSLIKSHGIGDLFKLYLIAQRDQIAFQLAHVPDSFQEEASELFDPVYMGKLYEVGFAEAKNGYPWLTEPPGLSTPETRVAAEAAAAAAAE